jgi:hypothetical protein
MEPQTYLFEVQGDVSWALDYETFSTTYDKSARYDLPPLTRLQITCAENGEISTFALVALVTRADEDSHLPPKAQVSNN